MRMKTLSNDKIIAEMIFTKTEMTHIPTRLSSRIWNKETKPDER